MEDEKISCVECKRLNEEILKLKVCKCAYQPDLLINMYQDMLNQTNKVIGLIGKDNERLQQQNYQIGTHNEELKHSLSFFQKEQELRSVINMRYEKTENSN